MKKIQAMAFPKGEAEAQISHLSLPMSNHIMKLLLFPGCPQVKGWTKEVRAWYLTCRRYGNNLKGGRAFKSKDYVNFLFKIPFARDSDFKEVQEQVIEQNDRLIPNVIDAFELKGLITVVYAEMCDCLAQNKDWAIFVVLLQNLTGTD